MGISNLIYGVGDNAKVFLGVLTIIFVTLKLTEVVAWSWFWVLSPILLGFPIAFLGMVIIGVAVWYAVERG